MTNWCDNLITITGDEVKIKTILMKLGTIPDPSRESIFETLIGNPSKQPNLIRFGTSWDVSPENTKITFNNTRIEMKVSTVSFPPTEFCEHLSNEYDVEVVIDYSGRKFAGKEIYFNHTIKTFEYEFVE